MEPPAAVDFAVPPLGNSEPIEGSRMDHSEGLRADVLANPIPDPTSPTGDDDVTTEFVMVPREPTQEMLIAANSAWFIPDPSPFNKGDEARRAIYKAMIAAAPPSPPPSSVKAREIDAFEAGYIQGHDATVEGRYADPSDAAQDYVRTLLVPTVDERAASSEPEMCPNCVTPWKCNGPHEFPAASSEAAKVDGIHTPATCRHPHCNCEHGCVADPAPTTADAGVTEANLVRFWRNRYISELTLRIRNRGVNLEVAIAEAEHVANEAERALKAALARAGGK